MATPESTPEPPTETTSPDTAAAASDLRMATFRLARRLRAERAVDTMSDGQYAVLATLRIHGDLTLSELAERERVTAPSMNRTVNCLIEEGWITRTPDENDRRKVNISLAAKGRALIEETTRRRDAWLEEALADLSPRERSVLARAADIMRAVARR